MAQFAVEISDEDVPRLISAMTSNYGYQAIIENPSFDPEQDEDEVTNPPKIANPQTPMQFANMQVRKFLSDNVRAYELELAKKAALDGIDISISITDPQV